MVPHLKRFEPINRFVSPSGTGRIGNKSVLSFSEINVNVYIYRYALLDNAGIVKSKHSLRYWPFVRGIHGWPVVSPQKGLWRSAPSALWKIAQTHVLPITVEMYHLLRKLLRLSYPSFLVLLMPYHQLNQIGPAQRGSPRTTIELYLTIIWHSVVIWICLF